MAEAVRARQRSVDYRTRRLGDALEILDPARFWQEDWRAALDRNGVRAAADAMRLALAPLTLAVEGQTTTLSVSDGKLHAVAGERGERCVELDCSAFTDLVSDRKTAMGLLVGDRVKGSGKSCALFCAWDPILRSVLDGRGVYRPGEIGLRDLEGSPLRLDQTFSFDESPAAAAHFLSETGFVLLKNVVDKEVLAQLDDDLTRSLAAARPDDGEAWWATTAEGGQYPCRILNFARKSDAFQSMIGETRFQAIGNLLPDGHAPGDSFGEHFGDISAEGLVKRVDSVAGLSCLPWHKDCERGGHTLFCAGVTLGICLTPINKAHGGLEVIAGSHRANVTREQVASGIDLPVAVLQAEPGDITVHLSCAFHRSTHPVSSERRVIYTGFALPPLPGDSRGEVDRGALEEERSLIGDKRPPPEIRSPGANGA
ncbi:MAG: phytanoyl-CoA dioxygenase family protein [Halioglobus sp.]|nr:phytanoyl-CoA dioxygenase family protein [Halioglobus sp.]